MFSSVEKTGFGKVQINTGKGNRTNAETLKKRMIEVAVAKVTTTGLTVSLDHLSFENVIEEADVSRSSAYRVWQSRNDFMQELMLTLSATDWQDAVNADRPSMAPALNAMRVHCTNFDTPESRRAIWAEGARVACLNEYSLLSDRPQWRTYLAIRAALMSTPAGDFKERIEDSLAEAHAALTELIGVSYSGFSRLFGYEPRFPEMRWQHIAATCLNVLEGAALRSFGRDLPADQHWEAAPFGGAPAQWSPLTMSYVSTFDALLRPIEGFIAPTATEVCAIIDQYLEKYSKE